jgi:TP901 family phage tail tape measure protein
MDDNVGSIQYDARIETKNLKTDAAEAERIAKQTGDNIGDSIDKGTGKADAAFQKFAGHLKTGLIAGGLAAAAGLAVATASAATYESSLSKLSQASGATGAEMSEMSKLARELGQSNDLAGVSASDAAATMIELSKAGLSVKDTMDSSKAVMSLAKAGNIEFADAAVIAASALNAFGLEGKDAIKVADTLAAGANASQAELGDLADGMQQSATVAKQFGLNLNESVTALALFANNGIKGSDAGTSLKTMLIALAKPSAGAASAMKEIGFEAYNAEGKFVGLEEMSKRLRKSTEKLTEEQKQNALATIFGTDAFRAAAVLADNAGDSYSDMSKKLSEAGAAQKAAAAQLGPAEKASEAFNNSIAELALTAGSYTAPMFTRMTNSATGFIQSVNSGLPGAITTFKQLLPVITGLTAGIVAFTAVQNAAGVSTRALTLAQGALNFAMRANPYALMVAGAVAIATTYASVMTQTDGTKNATDRLNQARREAKTATDAAKASEDLYRGALLTQEGASLAVERAQRSYNEAVAQFGPKSLEAREAELNLKRATDDKKNADLQATAALQERDRKQEESNAKAEAVKQAEKAKKDAIAETTVSVHAQGREIDILSGKLNHLNGFKATYTVEEARRVVMDGVSSPAAKQEAWKSFVPNRASGGPVSANQPYFVGDNPDGSLNRTTELFVPRTPGHIVSSSDLQDALRGGGSGGSNQTVQINLSLSGVMTSSAAEERALAKRLIDRFNEELRAKGLPQVGVRA